MITEIVARDLKAVGASIMLVFRAFFAVPTVFIALAAPLWAAAPSSTTHPNAFWKDFSAPADAEMVKPYAAPGGVAANVEIQNSNGALRFVNKSGGSFGLSFGVAPFDADKFTHLVFDYRIGNDAKINVFFKVNGIYHGVIFTGPTQVRPGSVLLGQIPDVQTDAQWHRAIVPLRSWLRNKYPLQETLKVEEMIVGNWDNDGYLLAGIGGNGPGASWSLDNFALVGAGPQSGKIGLDGAPNFSLDGGTQQKSNGEWAFGNLAPGFHLVTALYGGEKSASYPFWTATKPNAGTPIWKNNTLVWPLSEGAGLDTKALKLALAGKTYGLESPFLTYDALTNQLRFNAGLAGLNWKGGTIFPAKLSGIADIVGQTAPESGAGLTIDYFQHQSGPLWPFVHFVDEGETGDGSFEEDKDEWAPMGSLGAIVERDTQNPASGRYALRLTCPRSATDFGAQIRTTLFDAEKFPIIAFDYRVSDRLRMDFFVQSADKTYRIQFTDRADENRKNAKEPQTLLGTIPSVEADEKWHHAEIPLLEWLQKAAPDAKTRVVTKVWAQDTGWLGNARGVQYWIDNFHFVPRFAEGDLKATVELRDITGVQGVSWLLDARPDSTPDETSENARNRIEAKGKGRLWLHVRAQNGAGQWSQTAHWPVLFGDR